MECNSRLTALERTLCSERLGCTKHDPALHTTTRGLDKQPTVYCVCVYLVVLDLSVYSDVSAPDGGCVSSDLNVFV